MFQANFTITYDEMIDLLSKDRNEAFALMMKKIFDAFLIAESDIQIGVGKHESSENKTDS